MEAERGNFTIPQDQEVISADGTFKVPPAVLDHYQDMLRAAPSPIATQSETPRP